MSFIRSLAKAALPPAVTVRLRATFKRHELERLLLPALCDPKKAGLDIGAALGAYTWPLSRLCQSCIAFEPNPLQAAYLRRALGKSVRIENCALSDQDGETTLLIPLERGRDMAGLATVGSGEWLQGREVRRQTVIMHRLDSFDLPPVGFIKLDVEGHELAVLKGAGNLLRRDKPILLTELEERFAEGAIAQVASLLEPLDYRGFFLEKDRFRPWQTFNVSIHQAMENWGVIGRYINNFIWITEQALPSAAERLSRLGYPLNS
ncbi:MAG TPA: FkbM family methyltransferase [Rhizomicrobium sp.]|nr:FkbM family methyltransferase [Rhizomicrobium sp.]